MAEINERICQLIEVLGVKKTAFARQINVSQAFVSQLCSGASQPSDRTVSDICREFGVNEIWLRTGGGEMFQPISRDEELAAFFGDVLSGDPDFKRRLISALARLSESQWEVLEGIAKRLLDEQKNTDTK